MMHCVTMKKYMKITTTICVNTLIFPQIYLSESSRNIIGLNNSASIHDCIISVNVGQAVYLCRVMKSYYGKRYFGSIVPSNESYIAKRRTNSFASFFYTPLTAESALSVKFEKPLHYSFDNLPIIKIFNIQLKVPHAYRLYISTRSVRFSSAASQDYLSNLAFFTV